MMLHIIESIIVMRTFELLALEPYSDGSQYAVDELLVSPTRAFMLNRK